MKVLVVDDSRTVREVLRTVLQSRGFEVREAADGVDALAIGKTESFDLLVTDVVMEQMGGIELAHSLAKLYPHLPILFISGFPFDFEAERRRLARCAFLSKPFEFGDLFRTISELTAKKASE